MSEHKFYPFDQSPFYKLSSKKRLAELLGLSVSGLNHLVAKGVKYKEWDEPKRSGKGIRHIENPEKQLKLIQRKLNKKLSKLAAPNHLFCPVKRRSFIHNAKAHAVSAEIRTLDIKDYFPSTSSRRVYWFWHKRMLCASNIAGILTEISCLNGHLPTGSPLSPIMSFYAHMDIWENIAAIAKKAGCKLTVYIDDITISGPAIKKQVLWNIKKEISKTGLRYHKEKKFTDNWAEITGIIVSDGKLSAPNRTLKTIHLLHKEIRAKKDEAERSRLLQRLKSYETHIRQIKNVEQAQQN